ncbi:hypothetical protein PybrP1_003601 [[Pythium] brassicae (nom. inval.)]|nr:hypothetical protein PybrP1_003601 [[Pythium] brassicae (nom. inval.)]
MGSGAITTSTSTPAAPTLKAARYQSSVAPHFPMKTMLTPRGPLAASLAKSSPSAASSSHPQPVHHQHQHHLFNPTSLLDANGSMAAAFAASTAPGSSSGGPSVVCKVPKFLRSLYAILQTEDPSVIAWLQNQELRPNRVTAFHILDMGRFESSGVCTFSHNSFPPDPNHTGVMRASIREQWRQKSSVVCPSALDGGAGTQHQQHQHQPPRRRVGNGITKADRKSRRPMSVQIPQAETSFMDLYKSPLNSMLLCGDGRPGSGQQQQSSLYAPSHQPALKKLARPLQDLGLEAFDESYKHFILPPLQQQHPQHLLTNTPRGFYSALHEGEPTTPSLGGFPHARNLEYNLKPYEYPEKPHTGCQAGMDASFTGAFLEPWAWDANVNSALELGAFPLDFDWHDANSGGAHQQHQPFASVSVSIGVAQQQQQQQFHKDALSMLKLEAQHQQPQDRAMPSAEELGLDPFLFAE